MMRKLIVLFSIPLILSSCKKEESPDPSKVNGGGGNVNTFPGPKAQVIISKKWKLTDRMVEYSNGLPSENYSNVPACQKDNLLIFKADKKYDVDETTDVCPGNTPITTYNWTTANDEQAVTMNNINWDIVSVDNTTLKLRNVNASQFLTVTTLETYTAQ